VWGHCWSCRAHTSRIVHLADSANFEGVTSDKRYSGLTGSCFESPNDTIHVSIVPHADMFYINKIKKLMGIAYLV
jgi:hypothetical protein